MGRKREKSFVIWLLLKTFEYKNHFFVCFVFDLMAYDDGNDRKIFVFFWNVMRQVGQLRF